MGGYAEIPNFVNISSFVIPHNHRAGIKSSEISSFVNISRKFPGLWSLAFPKLGNSSFVSLNFTFLALGSHFQLCEVFQLCA